MGTSSKPRWFRVETDAFESVKLVTLRQRRHYESMALWFDGLAYAVRNLTDGYVPRDILRMRGYRKSAVQPLLDVVLWYDAIPLPGMEIQGLNDGWLIHDFLAYQPSKAQWEHVSEQRKLAAEARWHSL